MTLSELRDLASRMDAQAERVKTTPDATIAVNSMLFLALHALVRHTLKETKAGPTDVLRCMHFNPVMECTDERCVRMVERKMLKDAPTP